MISRAFSSIVILTFIFLSCNSEKNEIKGIWTDQKMPESYTHYNFNRNGTYSGLVFEQGNRSFRHASIGYFEYVGNREFNLYEAAIDLTSIIGKPLSDPAIGMHIMKSLDSMVKHDLENTNPSFVAQIQGDGEHLHILKDDDIIIELWLKHIKFGDKR